jgi:hypothetical protein
MRLKLQRPVSIGGAEKICPLEDFGKAELVEGHDNGAYRLLAADNENFDRLAIGAGVAVELEGEFEVDWPSRFGVEDAGTVAGGGFGLHSVSTDLMTSIIVNKSVAVNKSVVYVSMLV